MPIKKGTNWLLWIILGILLVVMLNYCTTQQKSSESTSQSQSITENEPLTPESGCMTNDDCNFQTEQCVDNVCEPWDPLEGYE